MNKSKNQQILSGGQAIVETLKIEGVKYVFGLILLGFFIFNTDCH